MFRNSIFRSAGTQVSFTCNRIFFLSRNIKVPLFNPSIQKSFFHHSSELKDSQESVDNNNLYDNNSDNIVTKNVFESILKRFDGTMFVTHKKILEITKEIVLCVQVRFFFLIYNVWLVVS